MEELAERFDERLRQSCRLSSELGFTPTVFMGVLGRHGGVQTAKRLILAGGIQNGLHRLAELGQLDISMERIMMEPEFASLFTADELAAAQWRLDRLS